MLCMIIIPVMKQHDFWLCCYSNKQISIQFNYIQNGFTLYKKLD